MLRECEDPGFDGDVDYLVIAMHFPEKPEASNRLAVARFSHRYDEPDSNRRIGDKGMCVQFDQLQPFCLATAVSQLEQAHLDQRLQNTHCDKNGNLRSRLHKDRPPSR